MIIESSSVSMASYRTYEERNQKTEEFRQWGGAEKNQRRPSRNNTENALPRDIVSVSKKALALTKQPRGPEKAQGEPAAEKNHTDARFSKLKQLIEAITGKKIKLKEIVLDPDKIESQAYQPPEKPPEGESPRSEQGWGMRYRYYESHYEYESISFAAQGKVSTADGHEISFSVNLEMSREYMSEEYLEINAGDPLIDPLTLTWDGTAAELSDMKFDFDLDADGSKESISNLKPGTGFLVFDKNRDGVINNGSELFGPATGDGFDELSRYDEDGNNWIDENDTIYTDLSLWRKDSANQDSLISLKNAGVGAIYLDNVSTEFDLKSATNTLNGKLQNTGIYLKENGSAGIVQQLDLAV